MGGGGGISQGTLSHPHHTVLACSPLVLVDSHGFNALAQGKERVVDVTSLFDSHASCSSLGRTFSSS